MSWLAGSWLMASVCMDLMRQMSSAILAVCGSRSDIHMPLSPCCLKSANDGTMGKLDCPEDMPVRRCPEDVRKSFMSFLNSSLRCGL